MVIECPDCGCGIAHRRNEWTGDKSRPDNKRKTKSYLVLFFKIRLKLAACYKNIVLFIVKEVTV